MPAFGARSVVGHGRSSLEIAEEQKSLSFSVQPARILFQIYRKKSHGFFQLCEEDLLLRSTSSLDCASLRCG